MSTVSMLGHIAYRRTDGRSPGVVFIHGYRSDMEGAKAVALQQNMDEFGHAYVRFDLRGHGLSKSSKEFTEHLLSDWFKDASRVLRELTAGPQIIVGSSLGGWLALLLARDMPDRVAHIIGIAPAPDFTKGLEKRGRVTEKGVFFGTDSFVSNEFIKDSQALYMLDGPLAIKSKITLLHGKQDKEVPWQVSEKVRSLLEPGQCTVHYIQEGDHNLKRPEDLALLKRTIEVTLAENHDNSHS